MAARGPLYFTFYFKCNTHHNFNTIIDDGEDDPNFPGLRIYTDGSKSSKTGAALAIFDEPLQAQLSANVILILVDLKGVKVIGRG